MTFTQLSAPAFTTDSKHSATDGCRPRSRQGKNACHIMRTMYMYSFFSNKMIAKWLKNVIIQQEIEMA